MRCILKQNCCYKSYSIFNIICTTSNKLIRSIHNTKKSIFIAGTDTNVGKTVVSSWLCLHSGAEYFKPISSCSPGAETDTEFVKRTSGVKTYAPAYHFYHPLSPHLAAKLSATEIYSSSIIIPSTSNTLVVEGAGGLLVPLNTKELLIDLIKELRIGVVIVASSKQGTINHTLLSLEALRARSIEVIGVIVKGVPNQDNCDAIQFYGQANILAQVPNFESVTKEALLEVPLTPQLVKFFNEK